MRLQYVMPLTLTLGEQNFGGLLDQWLLIFIPLQFYFTKKITPGATLPSKDGAVIFLKAQ